jgi:hypothetical protein
MRRFIHLAGKRAVGGRIRVRSAAKPAFSRLLAHSVGAADIERAANVVPEGRAGSGLGATQERLEHGDQLFASRPDPFRGSAAAGSWVRPAEQGGR